LARRKSCCLKSFFNLIIFLVIAAAVIFLVPTAMAAVDSMHFFQLNSYRFDTHTKWMKEKGFEKRGIDTLKIARAFLPELESRSLEALCKYYNISLNAHRAEEDARATALLYGRLWEAFGDNEHAEASKNKIFQPYPLIYKIKKEGPATKAQKERLYRELDKHKIVPEYDVEHLTKNEASRYLDRILSEYGR